MPDTCPGVRNMQEIVNRKLKSKALAKRVESLEAEVAELKRQLPAVAEAHSQSPRAKDWRRTLGMFADDPTFDEALRLGREWRRRQPKC